MGSGLDLAGHDDFDEDLVGEVPNGRIVPRLGGVRDTAHPVREALHASVADAAHVGGVHAGPLHFAGHLAFLLDQTLTHLVGAEHVDRNGGFLLAGLMLMKSLRFMVYTSLLTIYAVSWMLGQIPSRRPARWPRTKRFRLKVGFWVAQGRHIEPAHSVNYPFSEPT